MQNINVLIIEDDIDACRMYEKIFSYIGLNTKTVMDGRSAMEHLRRAAPQIILLDLHLPRVRGDEILKMIRSTDKFKDTKVLAISADREMLNQVRYGADYTLPKPVDTLELRGIMMMLQSEFQLLQ